jgi:hypothetical protein
MSRNDCNKRLMIKFFRPVVLPLLLFILYIGSPLQAQVKTNNDIQKILEQYCKSVPYEEIFVHSDREDYIAGEDMWFNIYLVDRQSGKPSGRSKIAYFELLNPENSPVIQKRLMVVNGFSPGQVLLPDTLSSGMYTFRVYTNQMKNFLPGNCFMKSINVYNPFKKKGFKRKIIYDKSFNKKQNIEFFPEGGTLLNAINCKIALRIVDEFNKGLLYKGVVVDEKGDSITSFKTDKYGTGAFFLKPDKGKRYFVQVGDSVCFLPPVSENGISLKASFLESDSLAIRVSAVDNTVIEKNKTYLLLIRNNGITEYSEYCRLSGKELRITIPKKKLTPGISHIILFDGAGTPLSERLIYLKDWDISHSNLTVRDNYKKREKVTLEFDLNKDQVVPSDEVNLSLSVALETPGIRPPEIDDYLIFGTEFGPLPWSEAGEMISDVSSETIDNFLICARSRWISWDKILSGKLSSSDYEAEDDGHFFYGWLKDRNTQKPDSGKILFLSIPGKVATFQYARTDRTGHFGFVLPVDQFKRDLIIQPQIADDNITINIESSFSWKFPLSVSYYESVTTPFPKAVTNLSINYQVSKIYGSSYIKVEGKPEIIQQKPVKRFYGKPEIELVLDDYIKLPVMQEVFYELIPGVRLRSKKSGYEMRIINPSDNIFYEDPPLVMIDGVNINDLTLLANLDPETVEKIDIVKTTYLVGNFKLYGIVNVITRKGNFKGLTLPDYAAKLSYRVIEPEVSFYSPDYSESGKSQSRTPDLRNTLFWNPSIKPDKEGKVRIEFWTSDVAADYIINIQGIDASGKPFSFKKVIHVE